MIIVSKLADYGVIVASHLAMAPERQVNAARLAEETRLPRATVAKVLKAVSYTHLDVYKRQGAFQSGAVKTDSHQV